MSTPLENSCPNCGAPYTHRDNQTEIECEYCGTRFTIPGLFPVASSSTGRGYSLSPSESRNVRWLVYFIVGFVVLTVICSTVIPLCAGLLGALVPFVTLFR